MFIILNHHCSQDHLLDLFDGLKAFLPDQNNSLIKEAIARLEAEFEYDVAKVHHIQLALLKFQVKIVSNRYYNTG